MSHYTTLSSCNCYGEDPNQRWNYYYDTNTVDTSFSAQNTWGRLAAVQFAGNWLYEYSYNQAGRATQQRLKTPGAAYWLAANFDATYAWDNEGRVTSLAYPPVGYPHHGPAYAYAFDSMGRLSTMQENGVQVATAGYNWADQMTSLGYDSFSETRTYDPVMMQLARIVTATGPTAVMDMKYSYTAGANNGRITQSVDGVLNETVNYTYDPLNRLATAQATNNTWGNAYSYDGFGNLTAMAVTAGSAPNLSMNYDPATNRVVGWTYDANGNAGSGYDVENRLTGEGATTFIYDPAGKRMAQYDMVNGPNGMQPQNQKVHFYGITGQRLGTYTISSDGTTFYGASLNLYFGGKLIRSGGVTVATDRLGSVRGNSNGERMAYWPYGQERPLTGGSTTTDGREKFGTYFRDAAGVDYADQRYYTASAGRFWTPDPLGLAGVDLKNPTAWNRYAYAYDDPVNFYDPQGLWGCNPDFCKPYCPFGAGADGGGEPMPWDDYVSKQAWVRAEHPFAPKTKPALKFGGNVTKTFQKAWSTAWEDLRKAPCANDSGWSSSDLHDTLQNAQYQYLINYDSNINPDPSNIANTNFATQTVTINSVGPFANLGDNEIKIGGQTADISGDQYRTFVLLHELGHLTGMGEEIDANDYLNAFTKSIIQDCLGVKFH